MKSTKTKCRFAELPRDYEALCRLYLPRLIHDKAEYENTLEIAEAFAGFEEEMTRGQSDYFDLLTTLLEAWEKMHVKWRNVPPLELLKHLIEENGMNGSDLSRLLGGSRQMGPMILRGERSITAEHARKLGVRFHLDPGAFI
jgi:HTH-type transcriptional regulator/antitoxin HigA